MTLKDLCRGFEAAKLLQAVLGKHASLADDRPIGTPPYFDRQMPRLPPIARGVRRKQ